MSDIIQNIRSEPVISLYNGQMVACELLSQFRRRPKAAIVPFSGLTKDEKLFVFSQQLDVVSHITSTADTLVSVNVDMETAA